VRNEKLVAHQEARTPQLELRPMPTSLDVPLRGEADIAVHRRLYCAHYGACLDQSVKQGWTGFTCLRCPLRDTATASPGSEPFARQRRNPAGE
jgi:hypothetical protein